jgi:hypothetical protein
MAYDMAVVNTAYSTAVSMGATSKVLLALFEAAIVESGFRNLNYGDRDSVGYLQQRPSQGWPNPMDVPTATRSFVSKAMPIQGNHATAGQLAQAVQRSAFPLKYDAVAGPASTLLAQVKTSNPGAGSTQLGLPGSGELNAVNKALDFVADPATWVRASLFIGGVGFLFYGIVKMTGANPATVAKLAVFKGK